MPFQSKNNDSGIKKVTYRTVVQKKKEETDPRTPGRLNHWPLPSSLACPDGFLVSLINNWKNKKIL
jgi:hypothetical protein